ncbi:MAG: hypothetical protein MK110_10825 [Fuerstiella sp.]|nr:hypothetical protein [Fuerstiella sp.]
MSQHDTEEAYGKQLLLNGHATESIRRHLLMTHNQKNKVPMRIENL